MLVCYKKNTEAKGDFTQAMLGTCISSGHKKPNCFGTVQANKGTETLVYAILMYVILYLLALILGCIIIRNIPPFPSAFGFPVVQTTEQSKAKTWRPPNVF